VSIPLGMLIGTEVVIVRGPVGGKLWTAWACIPSPAVRIWLIPKVGSNLIE